MRTIRFWNKQDEKRSKSKDLKTKFNLKSLEVRKLNSQDRLKSHIPEEVRSLKIPMT